MSDNEGGGCAAPKCGCIALIVALGLIAKGGQETYTAIGNREPTVITYADYVKEKPSAKWLHITEVSLSVAETTYMENYGKIQEVYIPVVAASTGEGGQEAPRGRTHIVLFSDDAALLKEFEAVSKETDEAKALMGLLKLSETVNQLEVKGLVQYGIDLDSDTRSQIQGADPNLSPEFIVLAHGEEPNFVLAVLFVLGGLGVLALMGFMVLGGSGEEGEEGEPQDGSYDVLPAA